MSTELVVIALCVGLGTWVFRFAPTRLGMRVEGKHEVWERFFASIGPAAIVSLLFVSLLPEFTSGQIRTAIPALVGCLATVTAFYTLRRNVILATLTGTIAYGVVWGVEGMSPACLTCLWE